MLCMLSMHSSLLIAHADARPMYLQLIEQVQQRIAVGDWPAGHELPSIRALAAETRVSVITIKRAYSELERAGLIVTRQGRGSLWPTGRAQPVRRQELDGQLAAAADRGRRLGLSADALAERMREVARAHEGPEARREPPRSHEES
jgi:GntR family transcriptional regulator